MRLIYLKGGLDGLSSLELGHAAAYHAYCTLSEDPPLRNGTEYERETLIGLAVAEGTFQCFFPPSGL